MVKTDAIWHSIEVKGLDGTRVKITARWTHAERDAAVGHIIRLDSRLPSPETRLYWVEIKDENGAYQLATTWDWTAKDRQIALRRITELHRSARSRERATN